ncbi:MAG TPA: isoleucine--tRNA ligase [Hydrogenispora sp.]|jgi:isoleucyl-tRNA synthetase|nr:isoleucine--tRNA ligase [Hydrogenispora sp.]
MGGKFKEVDVKSPARKREEAILAQWSAQDMVKLSVAEREGAPPFIFYEGPPTANGRPGIHHVLARTIKDTVCRYKTMEGYQVNRKAGWDTHGLPVEIEVEKKLGLSSKQGIEEYGIEGFNRECRESVFTYEKEWRRMTERIGYWIDLDNPYITLDNNYIESVWWILKKYFEAGLIYEGHKIMPYCSRCGTPLASHEVSLGYKEEKVNSIYVRMKVVGKENEYFLVWTTTPWTLPSNVALAVNPAYTYVKARRPDEDTVYILVRERVAAVLGKGAEILEELKGEALLGTEYEQLLPFLKAEDPAFRVYGADFVSTEDGTGIVHIAPAFGEDDYQLGRKHNLPVLQPVDKEGKFTAEVAPWTGRFVRDADDEITAYLKSEGKLFQKERITHSYPYCWRCDTPLLYYARKSWYIEVTKYKDRLIANNNKIKWYPEHVGKGRFGNWLENLIDWSLSRDRYWGTPLNIWRCESCQQLTAVGSRQELAERALEPVDVANLDLHRPYIDEVHLRCDCGGRMTRTPEVIDCWFDSGSMPYAQWHYPFEHKDDFDQLFPADFICEGIDQTRGWFYSLLSISTFLFDQPAFKSVLVNDLVLDKKGQKMSKSRGNTVEPWSLFDKYGADATRWYLLAVSPPWMPTRFDEEGLKEISARFFGTLLNVYSFFTLYANIDGADPENYDVPVADREEIDRWLVSRFNSVTKQIRADMAEYELTKAVRTIQTFVIDDVSNWYVRRTRERFWAPEMNQNKKAVYRTLWEVLVGVAKLMAPFAPFLAEDIYGNLVRGAAKQPSVHVEYYPEPDEKLIDRELERHMGLVIDLVSLGRAARNRVQIKVRQPLAALRVDRKNEELLKPMEELVKEELNVKALHYVDAPDEYVEYTVKPNFAVLGPKYGSLMKQIGQALAQSAAADLVKTLRTDGKLTLTLDGTTVEMTAEDLEIRTADRPGYALEADRDNYVVLETNLTPALLQEGLAREIVSKVQNMRKNAQFELTDRIRITYWAGPEVTDAIGAFQGYILEETLAVAIEKVADQTEDLTEWDINGYSTKLKVEKI